MNDEKDEEIGFWDDIRALFPIYLRAVYNCRECGEDLKLIPIKLRDYHAEDPIKWICKETNEIEVFDYMGWERVSLIEYFFWRLSGK